MKTQAKILTLLLAAQTAFAGDLVSSTPKQPASANAVAALDKQTTNEKKVTVSPVLALAPEDALAIFYVRQPGDILNHPIWAVIGAERDSATDELRRALTEALSGPTMIAVCGVPTNPLSLRVEFATQPRGDTESFFNQLAENVFPALARAESCAEGAVESTGSMHAIRLPSPMPMTLLAGAKDGLVYGSSRPGDTEAWLVGDELSPRFADGAHAKKLAADALARPDAWVYFDPRSLLPLAIGELEREMPGLAHGLELDAIEFIAATLNWSGKGSLINATLGVVDDNASFAELVAPMNAPLRITEQIAPEDLFFVRGTWTNAADWLDSLHAIVRLIDRDIVEEFDAECAEFRAEYGIDPLEDFIGNFAGEWILGADFGASGRTSTLFAFELLDAIKFQSQTRSLADAFDLALDTTWCADTQVMSADEKGIDLAWALNGSYLLVSDNPETICASLTRQLNEDSPSANSPWMATAKQLPSEVAPMVFLNVSSLARLALAACGDDCDDEPELKSLAENLARAHAGAALAMSRGEGALIVHVTVTDAVRSEVGELAWRSVIKSLEASREMARRMVSMSNLRAITTACLSYANDNKGAWPESLSPLMVRGDVLPETFRAPYDEASEVITAENVDRVSSYLYRDGTGLTHEDVVLCERTLHGGGANFAFADGHVEWIEGSRAEQLLNQMRRDARQ